VAWGNGNVGPRKAKRAFLIFRRKRREGGGKVRKVGFVKTEAVISREEGFKNAVGGEADLRGVAGLNRRARNPHVKHVLQDLHHEFVDSRQESLQKNGGSRVKRSKQRR